MFDINWTTVIENTLGNFIPSIVVTGGAYLFANRFLNQIRISRKLSSYGFEAVGTKNQTRYEVENMCQNSSLIKMIFVSGQGYLQSNQDVLKSAMDAGLKIRFLCSRPNNEFLDNIERLEKKKNIRPKQTSINEEIKQILEQYSQYIQKGLFEIRFYSSGYRLPFILSYSKESDVTSAWLTMTLPPYKSAKNFILRGKRDLNDERTDDSLNFITMMEDHFDSLWQYGSVTLDELRQGQVNYFGSNQYSRWKKCYAEAKETMANRAGNTSVLIEVAAQHPLVKGKYPNDEFSKRLDEGILLYQKLTDQGKRVMFYIPGSRHQKAGIADEVSLSTAGKNYLLKKGINEQLIFADEENMRYKNEAGVYNSSDECFVASCLYKEKGFGELYCVCSSAQQMRKAISYIGFGLVPKMISVSTSDMYHDYIDECFINIPNLLYDADVLQKSSFVADYLRQDRTPR